MMASASGAEAWLLQIWNDDLPSSTIPSVTFGPDTVDWGVDVDSNDGVAVLVNCRYEVSGAGRWVPSVLRFDSTGSNTANKMIGLFVSSATSEPPMVGCLVNRSNNDEIVVFTVPKRDNETSLATIIGYNSDLSTVNFQVNSPTADANNGYAYLPNEDSFIVGNSFNYTYRFFADNFGNTGYNQTYRANRNYAFLPKVSCMNNSFSGNVVSNIDGFYEILEGSSNNHRAFRNSYNAGGANKKWDGQIYFPLGRPDTNFGGATSTYTPGASASSTYDMVATFGAHTINSSYENVYVVKCGFNSNTITASAETFLTQTNQNWRSGGIVCDSSGNVYLTCYYRADDFFVLKLDSNLNLDTCLRFYRIGESSSREIVCKAPLKISNDGSFVYLAITNEYLPLATGYARDVSILKMPTDMSLTGAFDWPGRAGGFAPYANQTSNISQLGIQDVTSSCSVSSAAETMSSLTIGGDPQAQTLSAVTNLTQYSQDLTYFGSGSGNFSSADAV